MPSPVKSPPTHRAPGPARCDLPGQLGKTVGAATVTGAIVAGSFALSTAQASARSAAPAKQAPAAAPVAAPAVTRIPAAAPTLNLGTTTLHFGSKGASVSALQAALNERGASLSVDGKFGSKTNDAVRSFQRSNGLKVDGRVGPATRAALGSGSSSSQPKLRSGDRGSDVKTLQNALNSAGASLSVDGKFGPATLKAVKSLQRSAGISVDGVVGPNTWGALNAGTGISGGGSGSGGSGSSFSGSAIVSLARQQIGTRYTWGGSSPSSGFDCSGLVYYAYKAQGITLKRTANSQATNGTVISKSQAQPGDLVAFSSGSSYNHIGVYVGGNTIIDASGSRKVVMERSIWNSPHIFITYR